MQQPKSSYPISWRIMDVCERFGGIFYSPNNHKFMPYLMLLPAFLLVGTLVAGLFFIGDASLRVLDTKTFQISDFWTLENYAKAVDQTFIHKIAWRSLSGAVLVTFFTLFLALPYAYLMIRTSNQYLRKFLLITLFLPFFIGQVVRAYGWLIILGSQGIANDALSLIGVEPIRLLFNYPAVIFGLVQYMLPFGVLMLSPAMTAVPEEVEIAAGSLGANWLQTVWYVILPMIKPGLVGAGVVIFTLTLTDFAMPTILGGGSQDFIAKAIYDQFFVTADQGFGSALALLLVAMGSLFVGLIFSIYGAGTLALGSEASDKNE